MSIFTKDCPQCTAANPTNAVRCACGHCFDPEAVTDKKAAVEVAIHEERLYHDYLAARVVQAEAEYEVARADATADPGDTYKAAQALAAEQALNTARAELRAQAQKTSQLKKLTARIAPAPRAAVPRAKSKHAVPARAPSKPIAIAKPVKATPTVPTPKVAKAAPAIVTPPPASKPAPAVARALPTAKPSRAFRARQAKQAEAIILKAAAVPSAMAPRPQAIAPPPPATKECPNCTSKVPANVPQCRCGFGFNAASMEMAALPLDAAALAILRR